MPEYKYTALKANGCETKGTTEALDKSDAISNLRKEGLFPTKIQLVSGVEPQASPSKEDNQKFVEEYLDRQPTSFNPLTILKNYIRHRILLGSLKDKEQDLYK